MRKVFINAGANKGSDIKRFQELYGDDWEIFAFEVEPQCFEHLEKYSVNIVKKAVSTKDGKDIFSKGVTTLSGTLRKDKDSKNMDPWGKTYEVETIDFSKWIKENFSKDDEIIMSMDIEGSEYDVINKMIEDDTLSYINKLYIETHEYCLKDIDALDDIGFKQKLIKLMGKNVYMFRYYQHEEFERLNVH